MKSVRLRGVVAIAVAAATGCGDSFTPPPADTPPDEAIETFITGGGLPAVAVAVVDGGETLYTKVAGVRKQGDPTPVGDGDAFHIGSNTKAMTALIAGTIVDAGQISWDSRVGDVLDGVVTVPAGYAGVTLAQLLSHTSGIPEIDAPTELAFNLSTEPADVQRRQLAGKTLALRPVSTAGTTFLYSNVNYVVAGLMLEVATGTSWELLLQERLFTPLGMTGAGFGVPATAHTTDAPWGHDPNPLDPAGPDIAPGFGPAGTVHASIGDLLPYLTMYMDGGVGPNGRIISEASLTAIETPRLEHYGFGWIVGHQDTGAFLMAHSGSNGNFFAHFILFPERRAAVVVMTNRGDVPSFDRVFQVVSYLVHHFGLPERRPLVD